MRRGELTQPEKPMRGRHPESISLVRNSMLEKAITGVRTQLPKLVNGNTFDERRNSMSNTTTTVSRRTMLGTLLAIPTLIPGQLRPTALGCESQDTAEARVRASLKGAKGTKLVLLGTGAGPLPGQGRHMQ